MNECNNQPVREHTQQYTHPGGGGVAGGVGGEGGERGERGERRGERRQGEERRAILRLLFIGEGDGGALTSSSPISRRCKDGSGSGGGSRRGSRSRRCWEGGAREGQQREGEERRAVLRLLFLEGDGGAAASSFPYLSDLARSLTGSNQGKLQTK